MGSASKKVLRAPGEATVQVAIGHGLRMGDGAFAIVAGPCALESEGQLDKAAEAVKSAGAHMLRGGAFKPRTSPYSFQGLGRAGLQLLAEQGRRHRMPVVSEIMDASQLAMMLEYVDVLQIGARNMQNFSLLREVAKLRCPVLLKRGFGATLEEWLQSAEYLLDGGNDRDPSSAAFAFDNTSATPSIRQGWCGSEHSKLPVIVDLSRHRLRHGDPHESRCRGEADGVMVRCTHSRGAARPRALSPAMFTQLMQALPLC